MPSYPNSVWSPTVKSAGTVIDASHINDPQDEIVAIEGGLLNGTARLNSSQSTVVSLSVSSNSTFAIRPTMPPPDAVFVFINSTVTIGSSALSTISWNSQSFITNSSMHSTTTNPTRLTPQSTGVYRCTAQISFELNSTGVRGVRIIDSTGDAVGQIRVQTSTSELMILQACGYKRFDVLGGYFTVQAVSSGASTMSLTSGVTATWAVLDKL